MNETDEQQHRIMTRFLLDALDEPERDQVLDRLAADPSYFEEMAATEDDLLVRWHRQQLSPEDRTLFARRYLDSPARRARVDETLALLEAARSWEQKEDARLWNRVRQWLMTPFHVPRLAFAAMLVALVSLAALASRNALFDVGAGGERPTETDRLVVFATTLGAPGDRAAGNRILGGGRAMDLLTLPLGTLEIRASFEIEAPGPDERFEAEIVPVDGGTVAQPSAPLIEPGPIVATVTVSMPAPPDGDYVLRLTRVAGGSPGVVTAHAFRVTRPDRDGR